MLKLISAQKARNLEIGEVKMNSVFVVSVECQSLQIQHWAFFQRGQTDVKSIVEACVAEGCSEA